MPGPCPNALDQVRPLLRNAPVSLIRMGLHHYSIAQRKTCPLGTDKRNFLIMSRKLLTPKQAAEAMGVSHDHVKDLIKEADNNKQSRWRFGREIVNLSQKTALRRTLRINLDAVLTAE